MNRQLHQNVKTLKDNSLFFDSCNFVKQSCIDLAAVAGSQSGRRIEVGGGGGGTLRQYY